MKYEIHQIKLTEAETDRINNGESFPKWTAYQKATICTHRNIDEAREQTNKSLENNFYTHVANITANSLDHVFEISNLQQEEDKVERLQPMRSVSVGDLITDENGVSSIVLGWGFINLKQEEEEKTPIINPVF